MEVNNLLQMKIFFNAIVLGMSIGLILDCFRIMRITIKFSEILVGIQDFILVVISALFTILYMVSFGDGYLRFYVVFAEIVGFAFYIYLVSPIVLGFYSKIFNEAVKVFKIISVTVFRPFAIIYIKLNRKFSKKEKKVKNYIRSICKNKKKHLQKPSDVLYNLSTGRKKRNIN